MFSPTGAPTYPRRDLRLRVRRALRRPAAAPLHVTGWGETCTRDVLVDAQLRGYVEGAVDDVETNQGDIDHLVLAPSRVLAIDSKWRGRHLSPHMLEADVRAALRSGRRAATVLESLSVAHDVTPVLVVWGGGREVLGWRRVINGVHVVAGPHLRGWLRDQARRDAEPLEDASTLLRDLRRYRERLTTSRGESPARVV